MIKIVFYELKRLLWNQFFVGLLAVVLFYAYQVLSRETLLGVAHTAPFSPWSFGRYLTRLLPLLWVGALFFLTFFTSAKERRTAALTGATPVQPWKYALARCAAALAGLALLSAAVLAMAALFYGRMFHWYDWPSLALAAGITLVPPLLFALGSGWALGRLCPWALYVWMLVPFALTLLPLPQAMGLWNGSLFSEYPLALGDLDPAFVLPASVWMVQGAILAAGILLLLISAPWRGGGRARAALP